MDSGTRGPAGPDHQPRTYFRIHSGLLQVGHEAIGIRVASQDPPVGLKHQRVHRTDGPGGIIHIIRQPQRRQLVRHRHIGAPEPRGGQPMLPSRKFSGVTGRPR